MNVTIEQLIPSIDSAIKGSLTKTPTTTTSIVGIVLLIILNLIQLGFHIKSSTCCGNTIQFDNDHGDGSKLINAATSILGALSTSPPSPPDENQTD